MALELKRTGAADYPDKLKLLISGPAKSGKTSYLGTIPNIIIADTEPHANNLQSVAHLNIPYITVEKLDDLKDLLVVLQDPTMRQEAAQRLRMPAIEAVAIDTLDTLQQIMKTERMREMRQTQFMRDDWGWLKEELTSIIRAFTALPIHVVFCVHTKTSTLGFGDEERNIVLPGLEGAIAQDVAGMVGYSLYCFRRQEIAPDGTPFVKYWMRTEGDEVFGYLGNRAAGQLPSIIEPDFKTIRDTAMKGRIKDTQAQPEPVAVAAPEPSPVPVPDPPEDNDDPITPNALTYVKRVYDGMGLPFPSAKIEAITMGKARLLVKTWQAVQADEASAGTKLDDARGTMLDILSAEGLLPEPTLDITASIESVLTQVGRDRGLIERAIAAERAKTKPRGTLLTRLTDLLGDLDLAQPVAQPEPVVESVVEPDPEPEPQRTAFDGIAGAPLIEAVSVQSVQASDGQGSAMAALAVLDAEVVGVSHCENCGNEIDDPSIASLARARFKKSFCTDCYILTTRSA